MALTTPILLSTVAFDATQAHTFTFNSVGGDQVVSNTLTIRLNSDNSTVYSQSQTTFVYEHTLPAGTLTNGNYYNAYITTSNSSGETSAQSNVIQFYCFSTPVLSLTNVTSGGTISNSTFTFNYTYSQAESEPLNSYVVNLYDASRNLISTSGEQYPNDTTVPLYLTHTFSGFEDNTLYYIQATGVTVNGSPVTSAEVNFTAVFDRPSAFTLFSVTNNCDGGYINVQSNVITIPGQVSPGDPVYIDNKELDLRQDGTYLEYSENINIGNQFFGILKCRDLNDNTNIISFLSPDGTKITIDYYVSIVDSDLTDKAYALLTASMGGYNYQIYSDPVTPPASDTTPINIQFKRDGNLYEIYMSVG